MNELKVEQNIDQSDINIEINKVPLKTFSYSNLLDKLRAEVEEKERNNEKNKNTSNVKQNKENNFSKKTFTKQNHDNKQSNNYEKLHKLSKVEYLEELKKCQKAFFNYLMEYLKEEVNVKVEESEPVNKKNPVKFIKKTNLNRIQSGSVNIIKAVKKLEKDEDLKYLNNLIQNRSMNFVQTLGTNMEKYGLMTTFRNKDTIWVHSPYYKV